MEVGIGSVEAISCTEGSWGGLRRGEVEKAR